MNDGEVNMLFKLYNHVHSSVLQLCAWEGAGTQQEYVEDFILMVSFHTTS